MLATVSPNGQLRLDGDGPPTRLLVATLDGVAVLERDGAGMPWRDAGRHLTGNHCSSLLVEPRNGWIFAGMHSGGVYRSRDGGERWEASSAGITRDHVFTVAAAEDAESVLLYAGTEPVGLFCSRDGGASWTELPALAAMPGREKWTFPGPPHEAHTKTLTFDPRDPRVVYAAIEQGALMRSRDGGTSWEELASYSRPEDFYYRDVHRVVLLPTNPDELFMTTGIGLYHSTDAGASWERLTDGSFRIGYPDHLIVSPLEPRTLFLSGAAKDPATWRSSHRAEGTVLRSRDLGRSWEPAAAGLPADGRVNLEAMTVAAYPGGFTLFVGTTDGEVYASDDGAGHWTLAGSGFPPVSKVRHYRNLQLARA